MLCPISFRILCFPFVSRYFMIFIAISFLTHWLFKSMPFNFHIFVNFLAFLMLLVSTFIPLWVENMLGLISVFLKLLRFIFKTYCIFWMMFHVHLRRMYYSAVVSWMFCMSARLNWYIVLFKSYVYLLIFSLILLSYIESEALKASTIIIEIFYDCLHVSKCLYFVPLMFDACVFIIILSSWWSDSFIM